MTGGACVAGGVHDRRNAWQGTCMAGGTCITGRHAWQGGVHGRRTCAAEGACMAGVGACMAGDTATAADGTHPTRMHSCLKKYDGFL